MSKVLVLYPKQFNCYTKFHRKMELVISRMQNIDLLYLSDENNLIGQYSKENHRINSIQVMSEFSSAVMTHAIVFDDGEEFPEEVKGLRESGVLVKYLKVSITRVVNIKTDSKYNSKHARFDYEYIGRGSYWGNPYSMNGTGDDRDEVIRKFKYDFDYNKFVNKEKSEVYRLAGKRLGCFCKPQECHGDVLANFLNSWDDES